LVVSKPIKDMMVREYKSRLEGASDAMLISIRGVKAIPTTKLRKDLAAKKIRVTVVRNSLARRAFAGTALEPLSKLLTGPSAVAYGGSSVVEVAREIVNAVKTMPELELKGAVLDGQLFEGKKGVEELSRFPTKEEAIAQAVTLIVAPAKKLLAAIKGPGTQVVGILKSIEERLEKGEAITKKAG
jgi:large subunit ribosomal protein L10